MARQPRIDYAGARHHVMNRGLSHSYIYIVPRARPRFQTLLGELDRRWGVRVSAFALMPTHYHLMVHSRWGQLSEAIQWLQSRFVQWTNEHIDKYDGPLFRGRYRNRVVVDDAYWQHLFAYVHANPRASGLAMTPPGWTSRDWLVGGAAPPWLDTAELLRAHGSGGAYLDYESRLIAGEDIGPEGFDEDQLWSPHESIFVGRVERHRPSLDQAIGIAAELTNVPPDRLFDVGPKPSPACWVATWWLWRGAGLRQQEIAEQLGVTQQTVSRRIRRVECRRHQPPFSRWTDALDRRLAWTGLP